MLRPFIVAVLATLFIAQDTHAQDTLLLMSGKEILGTDIHVDTMDVYYKSVEKKGKQKDRNIGFQEVFSIKRAGKEEEVLYWPSALSKNSFTIPQARSFILGQQDARKYHREVKSLAISFLISTAAAYVLPDAPWILMYPIAITAGMNVPVAKISQTVRDLRFSKYGKDQAYLQGYEQFAKERRRKNAFIGSLAGTILGVVLAANIN